ncbi:MAG: cytochrome c biogenesis CcdA family protein, partial [Actinomycetota bacterium]
MSDVLGLGALAFVAGGVSILTPCCLPLLPGYFSYLGGLAAGQEGQRKRVLGAGALFVLGFSVVFTALGAAASILGSFLLDRLPLFVKLAGVFVIVLGLATLGILRLP